MYLPVTILIFVYLPIIAAKLIGPQNSYPKTKTELGYSSVMASYGFITGGTVLILVIRIILSDLPKIQADPTYLVASNQWSYLLFTLIASIFVMFEVWLAPSRWQVFMLIMGATVTFLVFSILLESQIYDELVMYFLLCLEILVIISICGGFMYYIGVKYLRVRSPQWLRPLYIMPEKVGKIFILPKISLVILILIFIMSDLAWMAFPF